MPWLFWECQLPPLQWRDQGHQESSSTIANMNKTAVGQPTKAAEQTASRLSCCSTLVHPVRWLLLSAVATWSLCVLRVLCCALPAGRVVDEATQAAATLEATQQRRSASE
jgi:hypothetical protein